MARVFAGKICVLCASHPSSTLGEHVWPRWYLEDFPGKPGPYEWFRNGEPLRRRDDTPVVENELTRVRIPVCTSCNGLLNTRFEQPAKPLIRRLFGGTPLPALTATEVAAVATWLMKTWLLLPHPDVFYAHTLIDRAHLPMKWPSAAEPAFYRWLITGAPPPAGLSLWLHRTGDLEGPPPGGDRRLVLPTVHEDGRSIRFESHEVTFRTDPHDNGFIQHVLQFGVPEGGWHKREVIKEAIRRRIPELDPDRAPNAPAPTPPAPLHRDKVKPLAGLFRWTDEDGYEYCLLANDAESYELRRRPAAQDRVTWGRRRFRPTDGELVGRFDASLLHRAVAHGLLQLVEGVPAAMPCPAAPPPSDRILAELRQRRDDAQSRAAAAREEVLLASDDDEKEQYRSLGKEQQRRVRQLNIEIAREEAKRRPVPRTTHDGTRIAALVKILEDLPGATDAAVARALRGLVRTARIQGAEPTRPLARLEMTLALRTDTGSLTVGPIGVPVKNRAVGGMPGTDSRKAGFARRNINLLEALLLEAVPEDDRREIWETEGFTARNYTRRMFEALKPAAVGPQVASALIKCPSVDVRRAALEPYLRHGLPVADHFGAQLADELPRVYVPIGFSWTHGWCPGGMARERQVLALIDRYSEDPEAGLLTADVLRACAIEETALYRMAHEGDRPYGRPNGKPSPAPWYARIEILPGPGGPRSPGSRVRIRRCPHCGERKLLQPLRVPEVAGFLLCVNCRTALRSPIRYPDEFFLPWDGPQSLARRRPDAGTADESLWISTAGRIIVGTTLCTVHVPSLHAPRQRR